MVSEDRIDDLERRVERAERRVLRLEAVTLDGAPRLAGVPPVAERAPRRPRISVPELPAAPAVDLEALFGGRVLAWLGGAAVLVGLALMLALAITSGWLGEPARALLAAAGSFALLGAGVRLHERGGRAEAARAAAGAGLAGLFLTLSVATRAYDLVPVALGLPLAFATGGLAVGLAVRWHARAIAGIGIVGATLSPVLTAAPLDTAAMAFLAVAAGCSTAVVLWRRWDWLALAAFAVATPQWAWFLYDDARPAGAVALLVIFGALNAVAALGYEVRVPAVRVRPASAFLVVLNAVVLALAGYLSLRSLSGETAGVVWLAALAATHALAAAALSRWAAEARDVRLICLVLSVLVADVAFSIAVDGPARAIGWAAASIGFAALAHRGLARTGDRRLAELGLGGHVGLALVQAIVQVDTAQVAGPGASGEAVATLVALAAGCLVSGRLAEDVDARLRVGLDALGLGAVALIAALTLDGASLTTAWALEAVALAGIARRMDDHVAGRASWLHLAGAAVWAIADQGSPEHLVDGGVALGAAAQGLGSVALAALACARLATEPRERAALAGAGGVAALSLASLAAVALSPDAGSAEIVGGLAPQQGQLQLSALWAITGVAAVLVGLHRDVRALRLAALGLLALTTGKVFLFDLATLSAGYRVGSFIALGVLLLGASFAYARLRPEPLPDLREVPVGLR